MLDEAASPRLPNRNCEWHFRSVFSIGIYAARIPALNLRRENVGREVGLHRLV
jgi:hypothetical protein